MAEFDHQPPTESEIQRELIDAARKFFRYSEATHGFGMDFGSNRESFTYAFESMNMAPLIESGQVHIHNVLSNTGSGIHHMGGVVRYVRDLPIADALASVQVAEFGATQPIGQYLDPGLEFPKDGVKTWILYAHAAPAGKDGEVLSDLTKPVMVAGLVQNYTPYFHNPENEDGYDSDSHLSLSKLLLGAQGVKSSVDRQKIIATSDYMKRAKLSLETIGSANYFIHVGRATSIDFGGIAGASIRRSYDINRLDIPKKVSLKS